MHACSGAYSCMICRCACCSACPTEAGVDFLERWVVELMEASWAGPATPAALACICTGLPGLPGIMLIYAFAGKRLQIDRLFPAHPAKRTVRCSSGACFRTHALPAPDLAAICDPLGCRTPPAGCISSLPIPCPNAHDLPARCRPTTQQLACQAKPCNGSRRC